jgi:hypothetical protein
VHYAVHVEPLLIGNSPVAARSYERMSLHLPGMRHTLQTLHLRPKWHLPRRKLGRRQDLGYLEGVGVSTNIPLPSVYVQCSYLSSWLPPAAQWRRPGGRCARKPVGTYLYLHAVGVGSPVAMPGLARQGAERGTDICDPWDESMSGSHVRRVLEKHNVLHQHMDLPLGQSDMFFQ